MHTEVTVHRTWRAIAFLCCALMGFSACSTVPPVRTLPEHIQRIYIPEFRNDSRLFGAQADLTLAVNDEFMLDGRLDVVQNERADVRLEGKVLTFHEYNSASAGDEFPLISTMEMTCSISMWDPYDSDRIAPMSHWRVDAAVQYVSDARRTIAETQTEARDRLMQQMAKNIVAAVMTQPSAPRSDLEQRAIMRYQERQGKQNFEPAMTKPRFAKPTPPPRRSGN